MKTNDRILILVVEDSLTQAEELKFILEEHRYNVEHAMNGELALQKLGKIEPNIIISDIMMPGMDGYAFCSFVKSSERYKNIPVILLTSLSDPHDVIKGLESGADSFLTKPYNESLLISRINYFIQNTDLRKSQVDNSVAEVLYANHRHTISSSSRQILDILLSTYEDSIRKNEELIEINRDLKAAQDKLTRLNESLEETVRYRTKQLESTNQHLLEEIVERKQLAEELMRAQLMLKSSLESPRDMMILSIDKDYRYLYFNKAYEDFMLATYNRRVKTGMNVLECISADGDREKAKQNYDKAIDGTAHSTVDEYGGSEKIYYEVFFNPTIDQNNEIIGTTVFARDITERLRTEKAIIDNEAKFRAVFEGSLDANLLLDEQGFFDCNQSTLDLFGLKKKDGILNKQPAFYSPDFQPDGSPSGSASEKHASDALSSGGSFFEWTYKRADGSPFPAEVLLSRFTLNDKPVVMTTVREITERKKAEEALKESEKKYRNLFTEMSEGFALHEIICDKSGVPCDYRFIEVNPAFEKITGIKAAAIKGKTVKEVMPATEEYWIEAYGRVALTGQHIQFEDYSQTMGKFFHVTAYCPKPGQFATFFYDITERKKAELSLKESNELNKSLLQTIPFGMDIVDEQGTILFMNDVLTSMYGKTAIGKKCWRLYRDNKTQCESCPREKGFEIDQSSTLEVTDIFAGRIFQISNTGMMFQGKKAILEIFLDITDRKQNETELIKAKERAEEADKLKSAFLANMSHEIRTPLNSILGYSELLKDEDFDVNQKHHFTHIIALNGNQLLSIIDNIMDISKIESGQIETRYSVFDLNKALDEIYRDFSIKAREKGVEFIWDKFEKKSKFEINCDELRLKQIINNLVVNALKFTEQGFVEIGYTVSDSFIQFFVRDTGVGIPPEFHQKIFERFRQVNNGSTRKYGGNGLGLPISKSLVELLGGKIWIESEPGKGSTFYFTVPKDMISKN